MPIPTNMQDRKRNDGWLPQTPADRAKALYEFEHPTELAGKPSLRAMMPTHDAKDDLLGEARATLAGTQGTSDMFRRSGEQGGGQAMIDSAPKHTMAGRIGKSALDAAGPAATVGAFMAPEIGIPAEAYLGGSGLTNLAADGMEGVKNHPILSAMAALGAVAAPMRLNAFNKEAKIKESMAALAEMYGGHMPRPGVLTATEQPYRAAGEMPSLETPDYPRHQLGSVEPLGPKNTPVSRQAPTDDFEGALQNVTRGGFNPKREISLSRLRKSPLSDPEGVEQAVLGGGFNPKAEIEKVLTDRMTSGARSMPSVSEQDSLKALTDGSVFDDAGRLIAPPQGQILPTMAETDPVFAAHQASSRGKFGDTYFENSKISGKDVKQLKSEAYSRAQKNPKNWPR